MSIRISDNDKRTIKDIISSFRLRAVKVFSDDFRMLYDPATHQMQYENVYQYDRLPSEGSCLELMHTAYTRIREALPLLTVYRVVGTEPIHFAENPHGFLLVSDSDPLNGKSTHTFENAIPLIEQNPLLVDPSMKAIVPIMESGYKIVYLMNHGCKFIVTPSPVTKEGQKLPLLLEGDTVMYLYHHHAYRTLLGVEFMTPGMPEEQFELHSEAIGKRKNTPMQQEFIDAIRRKSVTYATQGLVMDKFQEFT